jgi:lysophospholipase L1-like esterase
VNDLYSNDSVKNIIRYFVSIIDSLQSHHIVPVIQSTLVVGAKYPQAEVKNKLIQTLNYWLAEYDLKNTIEFLNISLHGPKNGFLPDDLTYDGIHLNAKGNALGAPEVGNLLTKYKL